MHHTFVSEKCYVFYFFVFSFLPLTLVILLFTSITFFITWKERVDNCQLDFFAVFFFGFYFTKNGVLPLTTLFFKKFCFSLRTSYKELIWCTSDPNARICTFVSAGVLFDRAFSLWVSLSYVLFWLLLIA